MKATTINTIYREYEASILKALLVSLVALILLYGTFLFMAVQSAMVQRTSFKEGQGLGKEIVALESSYGALKETLTLEYAGKLGLVPLESSRFASRDEATRLTLDTR